jgi:hypothetical protein
MGLPFPRGALGDVSRLTLTTDDGTSPTLQARPLAHWADGSVKWLLLDFILDERTGLDKLLRLRAEPNNTESESPALHVHRQGHEIHVDTGAARFQIDCRTLGIFEQVMVGGSSVLNPDSCSVKLSNRKGRIAASQIEDVQIEASGPVRATIRLKGAFYGAVRCRFAVRLSFFAGTGLVRLDLTVHNPRRARHRGGLWDLGDPNSILFRELSLEFALQDSADTTTMWRTEPDGLIGDSPNGSLEIYQDSSGGENWNSRNHVNREGRVPCSFRGYRVRTGEQESTGFRANPVVLVRGADTGITAVVPEFWQQFPKSLEVEDRVLRIGLFPRQFNDCFELQPGEQKNHTIWLCFESAQTKSDFSLDWVHSPAVVSADPNWYARSGAVPHLSDSGSPPDPRLEEYVAEIVSGPNSLFARREIIDEYGWRNYGEVYADHENAYYQGVSPIISHYNNQYDIVWGCLLNYLRSCNARWHSLADALARHVSDIDIYHTQEDRAAYNGGLFWHTDHYRDAATCTHRCYSRHNAALGRQYGGGPCNEHIYTTGLLHHYYLTGNPNSRDAVLSLADWVVAMDDGRLTVFGILDEGPTGHASRTTEMNYHGPGRGCGNSINALLDGWLLTGRRYYLRYAETLIRRCIHPNDDVEQRNLLEVECRWSYTVFVTVLDRYMSLKADAGELDAKYAYARACLLHYATWMLDHEEPYFDHPEKLEFPTETWAAQELRKANVLAQAAGYAEEPLRSRLMHRSSEFSKRAWNDLARFESRSTTRALAILMIEGVKNYQLSQCCAAKSPMPIQLLEAGDPEQFVSQRRRVALRLNTVRGLASALMRIADIRRWRQQLQRSNASSVIGQEACDPDLCN